MNIVQNCLSKLLGIPSTSISVETVFDDLGIDSLQAITFIDLLSQTVGKDVDIDILYKYPNIKSFAGRIQELTTDSAPIKPVINIQNYTLDKTAGMPKVYESIGEKSLEILLQFISSSKQRLLDELHQYGALLFCGFDVITAEHLSGVVESFTVSNKSFLDYRDGISPRTRLTTKVFTSTEYPKRVNMSLHNEMSYSTNMPSIIFFFCEIPPVENTGQTPIGDSRAIFESVDHNILTEFIER
ncbi:unnamed protein product, partial [Didymodactylos carnosus]